MCRPFYAAVQQAVDQLLDDFTKGQGHNGQIVAAEPQYRGTNQETGDGGEERTQDHGYGQTNPVGGNGRLEGHGGDDAGEGADAHKARVAQAQLSQDAHSQIQGNGHGHIGADGYQLAAEGTADGSLFLQNCHDHEGDDYTGIGQEVRAGAFVAKIDFHSTHLTLSP